MQRFDDEIRIKGLKIFAYHGVYESEKRKGQNFLVDITLKLPLKKAGFTDRLSDTVSYAEVCEFALSKFSEKSYDLIEAAADTLARSILAKFPLCDAVSVEVYKPEAPIEAEFENVSVYITREWHEAFISVGSNIGEGEAQISAAKEIFSGFEGITIQKEAKLIITRPYGYVDQPDFTNGLWKIKTYLTPGELLARISETEQALKRERKIHWGPRTIDLDIIYYDDLVLVSEDLTIPHRDMQNRGFVLEPLKEIAPDVRHPISGLTAEEMLCKLK